MPRKTYSDSLIYAFSIKMAGKKNTLHYHDDANELYLATVDGGRQFTDHDSRPMVAGDIFYFPAGMNHYATGPDLGHAEALVINFSNRLFSKSTPGDTDVLEILTQMTQQSRDGNFRIADGTSGDYFSALFRGLIEENRMKAPAFLSKMKALLTEFLCSVARSGHLPIPPGLLQPANNQQRIWEVCRFIESNSAMELSVDQSATMANMSRSHFQSQFNTYTGKTFTEFLNGVRAQNAQKLLRETDLSLEDVAFQSGFGSVSNFYLVFRKEIGIPPRDIQSERS